MGIGQLRENIANLFSKFEKEKEDLPDDVTRDKYLRSLRRQRRVQMEEVEKERLKKQISAFEKKRFQRDFYGGKPAPRTPTKMKLFDMPKNTVKNPMTLDMGLQKLKKQKSSFFK